MIGGVVALFQPFLFVAYRYGFIMLLGSLLTFIVWSHVVPASFKADLDLPPFTITQHVIGAVAGVIVLIFLVSSAAAVNAPQPPYGLRERVWNSYDDERKAEVAAAATADFYNVEMPFLILFNILPALLVYFAVRELANALLSGDQRRQPVRAAPRASSALEH
jgi:hypothetical protein